MIASDTSSLSSYIKGEKGPDIEAIDLALEDNLLILPPVVLSELLTSFAHNDSIKIFVMRLYFLDIAKDYWERAGLMRHNMVKQGKKAKIADTLIAQSCIDHNVPLITRDSDFKKFVPYGLRLAIETKR